MSELVPGGNLPLPGGAVSVQVPGPFDVSALVTDDSGRVRGDAVAPPRPGQETVLLLAEIYRRGSGWKLRALGQGYADGLAGLARDFGVDVTEDSAPTAAPPVRSGTAPASPFPAPQRPATAPHQRAAAPPIPSSAPHRPATAPPIHSATPNHPSHTAPDPDGFLPLVNSARARAGSPPVSLDARLISAARAHASAMAAAGQLGVEGRDGVSVYQRVTATGFTYVTVGEHLVSGPRTPAEFVDYCLGSREPSRTLHDPAFTHAGLAYVTGGRSGDTYWTALWARPLTPQELARTAADVVELTNRERAGAGLPPLAVDPALTTAAQAHSADMIARAFYSHTSPDGSQPWDRAAASLRPALSGRGGGGLDEQSGAPGQHPQAHVHPHRRRLRGRRRGGHVLDAAFRRLTQTRERRVSRDLGGRTGSGKGCRYEG
jgi:uncharacterized protein YkwD